jgi:hypothetical protein
MIQQRDLGTLSTTPARTEVMAAIRQASHKTGVDFSYLLHEAEAESSLDPNAQAATSSARGLYQFVESTWLDVIDKHGGKHGLDAAAIAITRNSKGQAVVNNAQKRAEILQLRDDPRISALMAAELTKDNEAQLESKLGREVTHAELYMAHFLGAGGATRFLDSHDNNPDIEAQYIVPAAARANEAVFFKGGKALTLEQVLARFENKFDQHPALQAAGVAEPQVSATAANLVTEAATYAAQLTEPALATALPMISLPMISLPMNNLPTPHLPIAQLHTVESRAASLFALSILQTLSMPGKDERVGDYSGNYSNNYSGNYEWIV